jgi:GntR family transcriptional regulator
MPLVSEPSPPTPADAAALPLPGQSRYGWLAAGLRARITQGEWPPGTALPAEAALAREHGVALGTLRQALALLVDEGLLERRHGRGTFVRGGLDGASMLRFFRFRSGGTFRAGGSAVPQSTIRTRAVVPAGAAAAEALGLPAGAPVLTLERLRSLDGRPVLLERITLPLPLFAPLAESDPAGWDDLLYPMFQRVCGVTVHRAEDQLGFALLSAADAALLGLPAGHPGAQVQRRAFDLAGRCIELRHTQGDALAFEYTAQVR